MSLTVPFFKYEYINLFWLNKRKNTQLAAVYYNDLIAADKQTCYCVYWKREALGAREGTEAEQGWKRFPEGLTVTVYHANRPILAEAGGGKPSSDQNLPALLYLAHTSPWIFLKTHMKQMESSINERKGAHIKGRVDCCTTLPHLTDRGSQSWEYVWVQKHNSGNHRGWRFTCDSYPRLYTEPLRYNRSFFVQWQL